MGLDLSLRGAGIIVLDQDADLLYRGTVGFGLKKSAPERDVIERLIWVTNEVVGLARKYEVTNVGIEGYAFGSKFGGERLAELGGVVKTQLLMSRQLVPTSVPPKTARSIVFGKGLGGIKKDFVRPLLKQHGVVIDDPDQADAYVVARYLRWRVLKDGQGNE